VSPGRLWKKATLNKKILSPSGVVAWDFIPGYLKVAPLGLKMLDKKVPANATGAKKAYVFGGFLKPPKT